MTDKTGFEDEELESARAGAGRETGPLRAAGQILADRRFVQTASGEFYEYDKARKYWRPRKDHTMAAVVHRYQPKFSGHLRNETIGHIGVMCHDAELEWGRVADSEIALANGVLDLETMRLRDHTPDDWLDYALPHAWTPDTEVSAVWLAVLDDWLGEDSTAAAALQEFFGYVLMPHARYKKALVLFGDTDTGKSRPVAALKLIVGAGAYCSLGVDNMDDPKRLAIINHKRLNAITELKADAMIRDGGFKTLVSTEEPVFIDPKWGQVETIVPVAKHVIACNTLPGISDKTSATFERLLIVPFARRVERAKIDRFLDEKIAAEIAGVVAWAVAGAVRLHRQGGLFTEVGEAAEIIAEYKAESNPMYAFIKEETIEDAAGAVPLSALVERFNRKKFGRPVNSRQVGGWLRAAYGRAAIADRRFGDKVAVSLLGRRLAPFNAGIEGYADLGEPIK